MRRSVIRHIWEEEGRTQGFSE